MHLYTKFQLTMRICSRDNEQKLTHDGLMEIGNTIPCSSGFTVGHKKVWYILFLEEHLHIQTYHQSKSFNHALHVNIIKHYCHHFIKFLNSMKYVCFDCEQFSTIR